MGYQATYESIADHRVPEWYDDAKLGIFVHWGLYSVPAWAPRGDDIRAQVGDVGWERMFLNNPYAEWYQNTLRLVGSPTRRHHDETYGSGFEYDDFSSAFLAASEAFNVEVWADLFARIHARYVVFTTKHHDGFLMWPSAHANPRRGRPYGSARDLVGEVAVAMRQRGLRVGLYYSGGLDWTFEREPVRGYMDVYSSIVQDPAFASYATAHWHELIERYEPAILWNDIGSPAAFDLPALFAHYYERIPDGLVNDRWSQALPDHIPGPGELINPPPARHADFTTPEYATYDQIKPDKWEATRGIGHSYGFNQLEGPDDHLSVEQLVHLFVDIVSKNGNLLLNVGPRADGTIPELQAGRLEGLGAWLDTNGEAIFGTSPWIRAEGRSSDGLAVRFTRSADTLYAILLGEPAVTELVLEGLLLAEGSSVRLLGYPKDLRHRVDADGMAVAVPADRAASVAPVLVISPIPLA